MKIKFDFWYNLFCNDYSTILTDSWKISQHEKVEEHPTNMCGLNPLKTVGKRELTHP